MTSISVSHEGAVTKVVLNRPEAMNAITLEMHVELQKAFDSFASDPMQQVCVVTGAGEKAFCAGSDLKEAAIGGYDAKYPEGGYAGLTSRFDCNKPFIAAVNGVALGGGFELALACDIIIAVQTARFGLPEPRVGSIALGGGLHRLARQIPLKQAMGAILTSRSLSASEGLRLGFVNEVVPVADLAGATGRCVADILASSPEAICASKAIVHRGLREPGIQAAIDNQPGYPEFVAWRDCEDVQEGPRAFAEKRAPRWRSGS